LAAVERPAARVPVLDLRAVLLRALLLRVVVVFSAIFVDQPL
jgi:hypothetical protein